MTGFGIFCRRIERKPSQLGFIVTGSVFTGLLTFLLFTGLCLGYIMPAEQLVELMGKNFQTFRSLKIVQLTQQDYGSDEESLWSFKEELILRSPGQYHSRVLDKGISRGHFPDSSYREFLLANDKERIIALMSKMGIAMESVGLTRLKGTIAYRIGDEEPGEPKIFVEKGSFLPLKVSYRPTGAPPGHVVKVVFQDYRQVGKGWYPFKIMVEPTTGPVETYIIQEIDLNIPVEHPPLSQPTPEASKDTEDEGRPRHPEDERLRSVIRSFEERYR